MEVPHPTVFVKKKIYEKYGTFSLKYKIAADYELLLRFFVKGVKFVYLDRILANFRLGGISYRQIGICMYETLDISIGYMAYIPPNEKNYFESIITHRWKAYCFRELLEIHPKKILDIVKDISDKNSEKDIVIFGAGKWGIDTYHILSKRGKFPLFLVDNNKTI